MPNFHFTKEQARALTFYMLSLTSEQMGTYYSSVRLIPSAGYGRQLFVEKNCIACHNIGGVGAKSGPDLLGVTKQHSPGWLDEQLVNPATDLSGEHHAGLRSGDQRQKGASSLSWPPPPPRMRRPSLSQRTKPLTPQDAAIEAGKQSFARFGCVGCHGLQLQGGVPNPNSQGGEVPSLLHASDDYTKEEVIKIIRNGKSAAR